MNNELIEYSYKTRKTPQNPNSQTITAEVAKFDWKKFKLQPNAAEFVEKMYYQKIKQMMRDAHDGKNNTSFEHCKSMEALIARSLVYSAQEISDWCDQQNWSAAGLDDTRANRIKKYLVNFAARKDGANAENQLPQNTKTILMERILAVVKEHDPLANWLFTRLSTSSNIDMDI